MKLRSIFVGLLMLVVLGALAACDTVPTGTSVATSVSESNPTTAADATQPTTEANAQPTTASVDSQPTTAPVGAQPTTAAVTPNVTGKSTRQPKTGPTFVFMPRQGGPGATVNITGGNFTPGQTVAIRIGIPQPIGEALASAQTGDDGRWNTSIKIPATEPSGKTITTTDMQIVVMDDKNQVLVSEPFSFRPSK